jgi:CubicO group peptidase (beta-lactamase class C family)
MTDAAATVLDAIRPHIDAGTIPGAVVGVLRDGETWLDAAGTTAPGGAPLTVDTLVRISSNTKPMAAALAMSLVEDGVFALDDPIDRFVPELANRRVLRRLDAPLDETEPAARPITVEDLLTMRLGFGFDFETDSLAVAAAAAAGLGIGPPDPAVPHTPDAWIARFAELPLLDHPGTTWRYDLAYAVLGVLLARAGGKPLEELLRSRLFEPLGMSDTGFVAAPDRLPPCYTVADNGLMVFDEAEHSRWATPPAFPDARGGLVSTATDLLRFAAALLAAGGGVLTADSVAAMTTDRLTAEQRRGPSAAVFLDGHGWGYGVQVINPGGGVLPRYGWGGGLGTLWYSWPEHGAAAVLLTQVLPPTGELVSAFTGAMESVLTA